MWEAYGGKPPYGLALVMPASPQVPEGSSFLHACTLGKSRAAPEERPSGSALATSRLAKSPLVVDIAVRRVVGESLQRVEQWSGRPMAAVVLSSASQLASS